MSTTTIIAVVIGVVIFFIIAALLIYLWATNSSGSSCGNGDCPDSCAGPCNTSCGNGDCPDSCAGTCSDDDNCNVDGLITGRNTNLQGSDVFLPSVDADPQQSTDGGYSSSIFSTTGRNVIASTYANSRIRWTIINNSSTTISLSVFGSSSPVYAILDQQGQGSYHWDDGYVYNGESYKMPFYNSMVIIMAFGSSVTSVSSNFNILTPNSDFVLNIKDGDNGTLITNIQTATRRITPP